MNKLDIIINKISSKYHLPKGVVLDALYNIIDDQDIQDSSAYNHEVIADIKNEFEIFSEIINPVDFDQFEINEDAMDAEIVLLLDAIMEEDISKRPNISHITNFDIAVDELSKIVQRDKSIVKQAFVQTMENEVHDYIDLNRTNEIKKIIQGQIGFIADEMDVYDHAVFNAAMRFVVNNKIQEIQVT